MKTVWKYEIPITERFSFAMPLGAAVVHVAVQHGKPCMWAQVDTERMSTVRHFQLVGTGQPLPKLGLGMHVGTFLVDDDGFVFHVFDLIGAPT